MYIEGDFSGEALEHAFVPLIHGTVRGRRYGASIQGIEFEIYRCERQFAPFESLPAEWIKEAEATLPKATILRKKRIARVTMLTRVAYQLLYPERERKAAVKAHQAGDDSVSYWWADHVLEHFDVLLTEFVEATSVIGKELRPRDDFQLATLLVDLRSLSSTIPREPDRFRRFLIAAERISSKDFKARQDALNVELQTNQPTLGEDQFWSIIEMIDVEQGETSRAAQALARFSERDIIEFEEILASKLFELDTERHACRGGAGSYEGSGDGFLYQRCRVVVAGRAFFEAVRADPSRMPQDDFEELLSLASTAFEQGTGAALRHTTRQSYETGSNVRGWPDG